MEKLSIGIDLGCTHIKAILVRKDGTVLKEHREDTEEHNDQHWKNAVDRIIKEFKSENQINAIGLSAPGLANATNTCIEFMPGRLPGLENFNWSDFTGDRIYVLNDAHAALMAEANFGVAKNLKHVVMLTLGTGVGGGILIDGNLYQGVGQMAGHLGHVTVDATNSVKDVTNMPGSLEDAIGNLTIKERTKGKFETTWDLVKAYEAKDSFATEVWLSSIRKLAVSIASFINVLSPELVIIGGGISKAEDLLLKPLNDYLNQFEWRPGGKHTPIRLAHFSDLAGALGAAGFALSKINQKL
ncbi:MAG TPA: ROK family protein [Cyclobacteriaceae bacterium]|nr:ROK family protein [Cyclobacteriaceae bacterium]HPW63018.1 ROK family protein [Cyclobacteriaceae bacterium]